MVNDMVNLCSVLSATNDMQVLLKGKPYSYSLIF